MPTIPVGTEVHVPIMAIHFDEEYYPDPHTFDPERFSAEAAAARPPSSFIPYGDGPRYCVGFRLAELMAKIALVRILRSFSVMPWWVWGIQIY